MGPTPEQSLTLPSKHMENNPEAPQEPCAMDVKEGEVALPVPEPCPSPHGGLIHQVLPLAVVFHVRVVGGEHGVEGKDLLLDGAAIHYLQRSTEAATGERAASVATLSSRQRGWGWGLRALGICRSQEAHCPVVPGEASGFRSQLPLEAPRTSPFYGCAD